MIIQKYKTLRKLPPEQFKEITSTNKIHYELDMKKKYKTLRKLPPEQFKEITSTNKIHYELDMKINIWK